MKTPLLLFFTLCVIETLVIANDELSKPKLKHSKDNYKRALNVPKLIQKPKSKSRKHFGKIAKKPNYNNEYTAFPTHVNKQAIQSSVYFAGDEHFDQPKLRVKKVLPDYWHIHDRKKRSPVKTEAGNVIKLENTDKKDSKLEAAKTKAKATEAAKDNTKPVDKPHQRGKNLQQVQLNLSSQPKNPAGKKTVGNKLEAAASKAVKTNKKKIKKARKGHKPHQRAKDLRIYNKSSPPVQPNLSSKPKNLAVKKTVGHKLKAAASNVKKTAKSVDKPHPEAKNHQINKREIGARRLIAARDAAIEMYPYVVSILKGGEHWCAGSLLNQRLVITTANCVWKSNRISRMRIRAGSRYVDHGGQLVNIAEVLKHPLWNIRSEPDYDIALLLTDDFIKFSHTCHAVDLPNRAMMPIFDDAWVASWGTERRDGVYDKRGQTLQVYHARLMDKETCNNVTLRFGVRVSENFICLEQNGRRAPCTRDTGAPAVSDGVLWGLASWGIRKMCGTERFPAMFTYTGSELNMDFIINGTKYLMSEERLSPFLDRYPFERVRNYSHRIWR